MVIHDEETLGEALLLVDSGSVRYSDTYMYAIITNRDTLESRGRSALERGDIAIVVPRGMEAEMEDHSVELKKVRERRRRQERKNIKTYLREHPEHVEKVRKRVKKIEEAK